MPIKGDKRDCVGVQLGERSVEAESLEATVLWKETRAGLWDGKQAWDKQEYADCQAGCLPQLQAPMGGAPELLVPSLM